MLRLLQWQKIWSRAILPIGYVPAPEAILLSVSTLVQASALLPEVSQELLR